MPTALIWFCFCVGYPGFLTQAISTKPNVATASLKQSPFRTSTKTQESSKISRELVKILVYRKKNGMEEDSTTNDNRIKCLVDSLIAARVSFDPFECLDGPMFVSSVIDGPTPLWEKLGDQYFNSFKKNFQGQQYSCSDAESNRQNTVINYAEIFGKSFHLRAYGSFMRETKRTKSDHDGTDKRQAIAESSSPLNAVSAWLSSVIAAGPALSIFPAQSSIIQCPANFVVTVDRASIFVHGRAINIPISGEGYLRVLYADPNLRIFISPRSTSDDRWEKSGLMVAQVRVDLIDPTFQIE